MSVQDELKLSRKDFSRIQRLVREVAGIDLGPTKTALVQARLTKEIKAKGFQTFSAYLDTLENDTSGQMLGKMIELLTTNYTFFFREPDHFELLKREFFPSISGRRVRCWSAGCSSGEEPYSLAMVGLEVFNGSTGADFRILATDISRRVLEFARQGIYSKKRLGPMAPYLVEKYFDVVAPGENGETSYKVKKPLRDVVSFAALNLLEPWPMQGPFDVIMCRNVMIYFAADTRLTLLRRFQQIIRPGGLLILGHSEFLECRSLPFEYVAPSVYRRI